MQRAGKGSASAVTGFLLGGIVADAAVLPLHWIYDAQKLAAAIKDVEAAPEFRTPSFNPFYTLPTGSSTAYGEQVLLVLDSLSEKQGRLDIGDVADKLYKRFGKGSNFDIPDRKNLPISGGWRTFSVTKFCENYEEGKRPPHQVVGTPDDTQSDCLIRLVPLVAAYAGKEDLLDRAEEIITLTQTSEEAVSYGLAMARVYEKVLLSPSNVNFEQVLREVAATLVDPHRKKPHASDKEVADFIEQVIAKVEKGVSYPDYQKELQLGCSLKMGLPGSLHLLLTLSKEGVPTSETYRAAIRSLIRVGGDTGSRGVIVGSLLGAQVGVEGLPHDWTAKTANFEHAKVLAEKLTSAL